MKVRLIHSYEKITSLENLLVAWQEFIKGKKRKRDVQEFSLCLMDNLFNLHHDLVNFTYKHGGYQAFNISDPKPRNIHKASVRDRLVHHAIYRNLYPFFDKTFIADSFSCRLNRGTHKALDRFRFFFRKMSKNNKRTGWILKCDIKKFFASINHQILMGILEKNIADPKTLWLLKEVIGSFTEIGEGVGLPLGNLTSQLFVNVYMNEFDQFVKHKLKAKYYLRYADDFVFLNRDRKDFEEFIPKVQSFLRGRLALKIHPEKIYLKTISSGVDFLGWVHFPDHRVLRTNSKKRMFRRILESPREETFQSYLGLLKHGNTFKIERELKRIYGEIKEKENPLRLEK